MTEPYLRAVTAAESPDGRDNQMGSGAFTKFQFMPATAAALAARTAWGRGLTPEQLKSTLLADEGKAVELAKMFTQDNEGALTRAGLPVNDASRFALHRFGPGGGVSLLKADAAMPVADWVRSVNWGQGISPDAVIRQNGLGRYFNVGDLRSRFITGQIGGAINPRDELPETKAPALPVTPQAALPPIQAAFTLPAPNFTDALASLFASQPTKQDKAAARDRERLRREALFAG